MAKRILDRTKLRHDVQPPRGWVITAAWLRKHLACEFHTARFALHWPRGMPVTRKNLARLAVLNLPIGWTAGRFLNAAAYLEFRGGHQAAYQKYIEKINKIDAQLGLLQNDDIRRKNTAAARTYKRALGLILADVLGVTR